VKENQDYFEQLNSSSGKLNVAKNELKEIQIENENANDAL
jgi:hypothetical protein